MDISVIITFHNEGLLAHPTLRALQMCLQHAFASGLKCETVLVLDRPSDETVKAVRVFVPDLPSCSEVHASHGDLGLSRNAGVDASTGSFVAICDGDDYFSPNWLASAFSYSQVHDPTCATIYHPEYVVNFGLQNSYARQVSRTDNRNKLGLFWDNWWCAWSFAPRSIYEQIRYSTNELDRSGFGFEDWHWNCETIAAGFAHDIVPRTVGYYRRKRQGLLRSTLGTRALPRYTQMFSRSSIKVLA